MEPGKAGVLEVGEESRGATFAEAGCDGEGVGAGADYEDRVEVRWIDGGYEGWGGSRREGARGVSGGGQQLQSPEMDEGGLGMEEEESESDDSESEYGVDPLIVV